LLTVFVIHIYLALRLKSRNLAARSEKYQYEATVQATLTSRTMVLTGLLILAFVVYHLAHYTFGIIQGQNGTNFRNLHDNLGRHDVYSMVIAGFSNLWVTLSYIVAQLILAMHLSHGTSSVFQTLGWNSPRYWPIIRLLAVVFTALLIAGNISIPLAVWMGLVK
jgi:succinate dehydrogenase cytochrome b subunit